MPSDYEIGELNQMTKAMNPHIDFDVPYTFYYDETNNIRKFVVREDSFNNSFQSNFILGGVVHDGDAPNTNDLFTGLKLDPDITEVKLKHLAKGDFLECLGSQRLNYFLNYLNASPLYMHFFSLNILYYSLVDIVDSAMMQSKAAMELGREFADSLKNDLYRLSKLEIESVIKLFYHYKYPNIKKEAVLPFVSDLVSLFEGYEDDPEFHFGLTSLKQILREAERSESLPFLHDEEDHVLLKEFAHFYIRPLYTFTTSQHVFDQEDEVQAVISKYRFLDGEQELHHYQFVDSRQAQLIQVSDILVGFIGKLFTFVNSHSREEVLDAIRGLSDLQAQTLDHYLDLSNKSEAKTASFFYQSTSGEDQAKYGMLFRIRNKI